MSMSYNQLCEKIENLDRRTTVLLDDFDVVDVLKDYLKCGTIQTITGYGALESVWINVRDKKSNHQVQSRTIIKVTCSDGIFVIDLQAKDEIVKESTYKDTLQKINSGVTLLYSKGYPKGRQSSKLNEVKIDYLERTHKFLDTMPGLFDHCTSIEQVLEFALQTIKEEKRI